MFCLAGFINNNFLLTGQNKALDLTLRMKPDFDF